MRVGKFLLIFIGFLLYALASDAKSNNPKTELLQKQQNLKNVFSNMERASGFELNKGQYDAEFTYRYSGQSACVDFYDNKVVFSLRKVKTKMDFEHPEKGMEFDFVVWEIDIAASEHSKLEGKGQVPLAKTNYMGPEGTSIRKELTKEILYKNVYPQTDLRFYTSENGELKYDFILHPGADLNAIKLTYTGVDDLKIEEDGKFSYLTDWGRITEETPYSYHLANGREVDIRYSLEDSTLGFAADFDIVESTVVLDPIYVDWSTYFYGDGNNGTTWAWTWVMDLDVDDSGNVYVTGMTNDRFPANIGAYDTSVNGFYDAYVCKLSENGDSIVWFTYIGGSSYEYSFTMGVNSAGQPVIAGFTNSADYPTTPGAYDNTRNGFWWNGFVSKISDDGSSLIFSTYFGGSNMTFINSVTLDGANNVYLAGRTNSSDFPTTSGCYQSTFGGSSSSSWYGGDAFLTKMNPTGTSLMFSTFIGGVGDDEAVEVALSPSGDVYVVGKTSSTNFYVSPGSSIFNFSLKGTMDGFICKFNSTGSTLRYSKLMGGSGEDWFEGVYINSRDEAYVAGVSKSSDFYTTSSAFQKTNKGGADMVVVKFNALGQNVVYSTYIGGSGDEFFYNYGFWGNSNVRIAANVREEAIVCGISRSNNFPVTSDALMTSNPSSMGIGWWNSSATITKLSYKGDQLLYGTYFGGSSYEYPSANRLKRTSCYTNILYGGFTSSPDYPTTAGSFRDSISATGSFYTGFITRFRDTLYTELIDLGLEDTLIECDVVYEFLDAKNIGADILWSTGHTYHYLIAEDTGTYWVQATYGCDTVWDTVTLVREYSPTTPILPNDSIYCDSFPSMVLDAKNDTIMASYLWSTSDTTQTIAIDSVGSYKVAISTPHCGTKTDTVNYILRYTPKIDLPPDSVFCDSVSQSVTVGRVNNDEEYLWSTLDSVPTIMVADTGWYGVSINNVCGSDTAAFHAALLQTPLLVLPVDSEFCDQVNYTVLIGLENNNEVYSITDVLNNRSILPADSFVLTEAGNYEISIDNQCGTAIDTLRVELIYTPAVDLGNDTMYCDNVNRVIDLTRLGNKEVYLWENGMFSPARTITSEGTYWVQIENKCGSVSDTIEIERVETPIANLPNDSVFCDNINIVLDATIAEASDYVWSSGQTTPSIQVNTEGNYVVTITNRCGVSKDSMAIGSITTPDADLGNDIIFCDRVVSTELTAGKINNKEVYLWSNNTTLPTTSFSTEGKHWVLISNKCGADSDTIEYVLIPNPIVDLGPDTTLCGRFEVILDAGNPGMNYSWEPYGETTQTIKATEQRVYRVTVSNQYGCEATDDFEILSDCISRMWIPDAFSPNDDGTNDFFKPTLVNYQDFYMAIYNRWGEKLFETDNPAIGWDGKYNGKIVPNGAYLYQMHFITTEDMMSRNFSGLVRVLR